MSKGLLKRDFSDISLATFFGIANFGNTSAMRVIFFLKVFKILSTFQNRRKKSEKAFYFLDNCIWTGCVNLSLLRRENLWPAVNVFTNSPKIFHITKKHWSIFHIDQSFTLINKYAKGAVVHTWKCLGPFTKLLFEGSSETGLFRHLSNHSSRSP